MLGQCFESLQFRISSPFKDNRTANQIETLTSPPPPGHTPGNLDFDVLVRSNALHIFVIPVQIHHVLRKIGVQIPHPMYELEATAFRNFGITKFFFPSETLFNRSEPFSCSQPRTKLISSHLNSPSSLAPFWIQHTCLKEKFKFPTP